MGVFPEGSSLACSWRCTCWQAAARMEKAGKVLGEKNKKENDKKDKVKGSDK